MLLVDGARLVACARPRAYGKPDALKLRAPWLHHLSPWVTFGKITSQADAVGAGNLSRQPQPVAAM